MGNGHDTPRTCPCYRGLFLSSRRVVSAVACAISASGRSGCRRRGLRTLRSCGGGAWQWGQSVVSPMAAEPDSYGGFDGSEHFRFRWNRLHGRVTTNVNGTSGWADLLARSGPGHLYVWGGCTNVRRIHVWLFGHPRSMAQCLRRFICSRPIGCPSSRRRPQLRPPVRPRPLSLCPRRLPQLRPRRRHRLLHHHRHLRPRQHRRSWQSRYRHRQLRQQHQHRHPRQYHRQLRPQLRSQQHLCQHCRAKEVRKRTRIP